MNKGKRKKSHLLHCDGQLPMDLPVPKARGDHPNVHRWLDVSECAVGTGFESKVVVSIALKDALTSATTDFDDDYNQRLFDLLWLARFKLSLDQLPYATFNFPFLHKDGMSEKAIEAHLRLRVETHDALVYVGLLQDF